VDVADDAEGSGGDEDADEVQLDEGNPTVEMASSISPCTRVERRLERRWSSGFDVVLDLLQKKFEEGVRGGRRFKAKRIEASGGARAHRRWRILPGMLADVRTSNEESRSLRCGSSGIAKGERERRLWRLYAGV
jgi:hypothetical protein